MYDYCKFLHFRNFITTKMVMTTLLSVWTRGGGSNYLMCINIMYMTWYHLFLMSKMYSGNCMTTVNSSIRLFQTNINLFGRGCDKTVVVLVPHCKLLHVRNFITTKMVHRRWTFLSVWTKGGVELSHVYQYHVYDLISFVFNE